MNVKIREVQGQPMTEQVEKGLKKIGITVSKPVLAAIAIIFGLLVIAFHDLLQWFVGLYLIIQGILLFIDYYELRRK
jgi:uncharacterized membrane protein HdeD (DUF308 family)